MLLSYFKGQRRSGHDGGSHGRPKPNPRPSNLGRHLCPCDRGHDSRAQRKERLGCPTSVAFVGAPCCRCGALARPHLARNDSKRRVPSPDDDRDPLPAGCGWGNRVHWGLRSSRASARGFAGDCALQQIASRSFGHGGRRRIPRFPATTPASRPVKDHCLDRGCSPGSRRRLRGQRWFGCDIHEHQAQDAVRQDDPTAHNRRGPRIPGQLSRTRSLGPDARPNVPESRPVDAARCLRSPYFRSAGLLSISRARGGTC